jgi:DNA-binding winged helix-turn-helix (wHTH) protein
VKTDNASWYAKVDLSRRVVNEFHCYSFVTRVSFGLFEADLKSGELWKAGRRVKLQSQPFKVLTVLLENAGEVVSREELQLCVWGPDIVVDFEHSLGSAVKKVREALDDSADNPRFIETLSKRGFRFIAPVSPLNPPVEVDFTAGPPSLQRSRGSKTNLFKQIWSLRHTLDSTVQSWQKIRACRTLFWTGPGGCRDCIQRMVHANQDPHLHCACRRLRRRDASTHPLILLSSPFLPQ